MCLTPFRLCIVLEVKSKDTFPSFADTEVFTCILFSFPLNSAIKSALSLSPNGIYIGIPYLTNEDIATLIANKDTDIWDESIIWTT